MFPDTSPEVQRSYIVPVNFGDDSDSDGPPSSENPLDMIPCNPTASFAAFNVRFQLDPTIPFNMREVSAFPYTEEWKAAADAEIATIRERKVWSLEPLPAGRHAVKNRMVFANRISSSGGVEPRKVRLVVHGFEQEEGRDYNKTFAPVAKFQSICIVLALTMFKGWHVHQMDVGAAFLYAPLQEEIYMQQPDGYIESGKEHLVCLLHKALYGLKQASRAWYPAHERGSAGVWLQALMGRQLRLFSASQRRDRYSLSLRG